MSRPNKISIKIISNSLKEKALVSKVGFEPTTPASQTQCSSQAELFRDYFNQEPTMY